MRNMASYCICNNSDCSKSQNCKRFMLKEVDNPVPIRFENICKEKNDYFYQIKMDAELVIKEEVDNNGVNNQN